MRYASLIQTFFEFIRERFELWGEAPLCNGRPERTFHIGDFCFFLCYRCFGILLGLFVTTVLLNIILTKMTVTKKCFLCVIIVGVLITIPTFIDGVIQYFFNVPSTNFRRMSTGMLAGIGIALVIFMFMNAVFNRPPRK